MDQTPQPVNNQKENKNSAAIPPLSSAAAVSSAASSVKPPVQAPQVSDNAAKPVLNMNTQHSGLQFKLASAEVQGPKPPLVSGTGSKFAPIAAILTLIIIAGLGGYYFYIKDNEAQPANTPAVITPEATPVVDKNLDSDKDGLLDTIEKVLGTYMTKADTDGDGFTDLQEIKSGYSPLISGGAGKYLPEEWDSVKGKIKIEDREFYEKEFEAPVPSQSPDLSPSSGLEKPSSNSPVPMENSDLK